MTITNKGQCACGNIEYSFTGDPINSAFCYCKECQMHTGTDKYFGLWVPKDNFHLDKGAPSSYVRKGDSGKDVIHYFCKDCGTNLYIDITVADMMSVAASTVGNSENLSPNMLIYTISAPRWAVFPEDIPQFERLPPNV